MWKGYDQFENTWEPEWHLNNAKDVFATYKESRFNLGQARGEA